MIVVSDTSAITSLLQIGRAELLSLIYNQVYIPDAVLNELLEEHASIPSFINCQAVSDVFAVKRLLVEIDLGEAEAIVLAKELKAEDLLIDEAEGRKVAAREGVHAIGLLGVLVQAKGRGCISSVRQVTGELESKAGFRVSDAVKQIIFRAAGEL
jgi:uncharacterized protein